MPIFKKTNIVSLMTNQYDIYLILLAVTNMANNKQKVYLL